MLNTLRPQIYQPTMLQAGQQEIIERLTPMGRHESLGGLGLQHEAVANNQVHEITSAQ
jgi:hypothetical protein